ncbi:MAG: hypothetical protein ACLFVG_05405 [Candidatus Aminicenantes bacterium]
MFHLENAGYKRDHINVYLMMGLPQKSPSGVKESILQVQRLGAKPRLAYFSPVPGTQDWQWMKENGYIDQNADPLLHNKLNFPFVRGNFSWEDFEFLRSLL